MSDKTTGTGPTWRVVSQVEQDQVGAAGQLVRGMRIGFVTGAGVPGSVFVPIDRYTPETVRGLIADHALTLDQVQGLTGAN